MDGPATRRLLAALEPRILASEAVIVGDYGKGVVTQTLVDGLKHICHARGVWLSLDPKPHDNQPAGDAQRTVEYTHWLQDRLVEAVEEVADKELQLEAVGV